MNSLLFLCCAAAALMVVESFRLKCDPLEVFPKKQCNFQRIGRYVRFAQEGLLLTDEAINHAFAVADEHVDLRESVRLPFPTCLFKELSIHAVLKKQESCNIDYAYLAESIEELYPNGKEQAGKFLFDAIFLIAGEDELKDMTFASCYKLKKRVAQYLREAYCAAPVATTQKPTLPPCEPATPKVEVPITMPPRDYE